MSHFNPPSSRIKPVVFLACLFSVGAIALTIRPTDAANLREASAQAISRAASDQPSSSTAINLAVNDAGDAADTNIGDSICDTSPTPGDQCTLRAAIQETNNATGDDTINFNLPTSTITLNNALDAINGNLTINGPGVNLLTVQRSTAGGTPNFRILTINSGKAATISDLTIANGNLTGGGNNGGGVLNNGTLTLTNCNIYGNSATNGGGIYNDGPSLTLNNCNIGGTAAGQPNSSGGIFHNGGSGVVPRSGTLLMTGGSIAGNTGGGIQIGARATLNEVAITDNSVGGGVFVSSNFPTNIFNCLIANNTNSSNGGFGGGGILNSLSTVNVVSSTISGNSTRGTGGGIYNFNATITLTNVTVTNNRSDSDSNGGEPAGGINGGALLKNTIVAGNFRGASPSTTADDIGGVTSSSSSFNLIGTGGSGGLTNGVNNNQVGVADAMLAPLADNGGRTMTHALLPGSPASDAGNNGFVTSPPFPIAPFTDQRGLGFNRIVDGPDSGTIATVDIGAYEKQPTFPDLIDVSGNEDTTIAVAFDVLDSGSITSITATSSNTTLVPNVPANIKVTSSGPFRLLIINPADNDFGGSDITITINRTSGSESRTFALTVNSVNDVPSFTKGPNQTVIENDGTQVINNWASGISAGPANESGQLLTFIISSNSNPSLFSAAPAVSSTGALTYTPAHGFSGTATITISLMDDGGTANGGVNTSATQSFSIQILDGGALALSTSTYSFNESVGSASITITRSGGSAGTATVLFATSDGTATAEDYSSLSQTVTFLQGEVSKTVNVDIINDLLNEPVETINLTLSNVGGSGQLGSQKTALLRILNDDPVGGYIRFFSANFGTTESSGSTSITAERVGTTSAAVTVDYATSDNSGATTAPCSTKNSFASSRCDYTTALGTLRFAAGESSKTFLVLISQDNYVEGPEALTLTLSNLTGGAAFAAPSTSTLTITDDATEPATNPIDNAEAFVRQHYHDFLNREPDAGGLAYWSSQITECQQPGATCDAEVRRVNVSAAFFLSIEFQETGYLVYRMYKAGYGNITGAPVPVRLTEFLSDTQQIGKDVTVGLPGWPEQLENNKVAFASDFVSRSRFIAAHPTTMSPAQFVDALFTNAGVIPSAADWDAAINEFGGLGNTASTTARARALRRVAENSRLAQQELNQAFVLLQYFGYMRRNPNDSPDSDYRGYDFWLAKLNEFNGNFINAEMVKAFIDSIEYRQRFGP